MSDPRRFRRLPSGVAGRLLVMQGAIVAICAGTVGIVAYAVGPRVFHRHLEHASLPSDSPAAAHIEHSFVISTAIAIAVGVGVAVLIAAALSWVISRMIQRSVAEVAESTARIGAGDYRVRVARSGLASEFDELSATVNALADKLEHVEGSRQRMLSDLGHEIRTPLSTISAMLEAVEDGVRAPDNRNIAILRSATSRLRRLADDIADVSAVTEGAPSLKRQSTITDALVNAAVGEAKARFAVQATELVTGTLVSARVDVDPDRMAQVLHNVLNNAARHTTEGGRVKISALLEGRDTVVITVTDNGDGIAPEHLPHIFDRFYRTDPSRSRDAGGTGIGLTIARAIVDAHGGTLTATSDGLGRGATFQVRLPIVANTPASGSAHTTGPQSVTVTQ